MESYDLSPWLCACCRSCSVCVSSFNSYCNNVLLSLGHSSQRGAVQSHTVKEVWACRIWARLPSQRLEEAHGTFLCSSTDGDARGRRHFTRLSQSCKINQGSTAQARRICKASYSMSHGTGTTGSFASDTFHYP